MGIIIGVLSIAALTLALASSLLFIRSIFVRWLLAVALPALACSTIYWSAVWMGGDESEYSGWSVLFIAGWYLPSYLVAVTFVYKTQGRIGLRKQLEVPKQVNEKPLVSFERGTLGLLVAPLAAIGLGLIAYPADGWPGVGLYAYVFSVWLGLPSYLLFRRMGWMGFWPITAAGTLLGFIMGLWFIPLTGFAFSASEWRSTLSLPALLCLQGTAVAAVFWLVAIAPYRRPALPVRSSQ